jgi:hypothetical protein
MGTRVPRTQEHLSLLISDKPNAWEYLLFAGALIIEMEPLESRYADYKLGYTPRLGVLVYEAQFPEYFSMQLGELKILASNFEAIYADEVLQSALGPPERRAIRPRSSIS